MDIEKVEDRPVEVAQIVAAPAAQHNNLWDSRYSKDGHIWGEGPGPIAPILLGMFEHEFAERRINILDFGCGYGRAALYFAEAGFNVVGIDESKVGVDLAQKLTRQRNGRILGTSLFQSGGIEVCKHYADASFDAVFSHRTLHLLSRSQVRNFARQAARLLPTGGILCVSARSPADFKPDQMVWLRGQEGTTAAYNLKVFPDRIGHVINFWDQARFERTFGRHFDISSVRDGVELDAVKNPVPTMLKTMIARRKDTACDTDPC